MVLLLLFFGDLNISLGYRNHIFSFTLNTNITRYTWTPIVQVLYINDYLYMNTTANKCAELLIYHLNIHMTVNKSPNSINKNKIQASFLFL